MVDGRSEMGDGDVPFEWVNGRCYQRLTRTMDGDGRTIVGQSSDDERERGMYGREREGRWVI